MIPLISHEIPKQLFRLDMRKINSNFPYKDAFGSFPYVLVHLLDPNGSHYDVDYANFYKECVKDYGYSILDNGIFELGTSYDDSILYALGEEYKTTHLILPDALHDKDKTLVQAKAYIEKYGKTSTPKFIGVLQGKNIEDAIECFNYFQSEKSIDVVAIPFDFIPLEECDDLESYRYQRIGLVSDLIDLLPYKPKKIHLLGCSTPNEFLYYTNKELKHIKSVDTSAPIVYGWTGIKFEQEVDFDKPKLKLAENLDVVLNEEQLEKIAFNVEKFNLYFQ